MVSGPGPEDHISMWKIERKSPQNWDQFLKIGLPEEGPLGGAPKLESISQNWFAEGRTPRPSPKLDLFLKIGLPETGPLVGAPKLDLLGPI